MILSDENRTIVDGVARSRSLFGVNVVDARDRDANPEASYFAVWHQGKWVSGKRNDTRVTGFGTLGSPPKHFLLVSAGGDVKIFGGGVDVVEHISLEHNQPITGLSLVDQIPFVYGMGRQVYRREGAGRWIPLHAQMLSASGELVGIQALCGGDEPSSLYAGGWHGEIWYFDGHRWWNQDSPTSVILSSVARTIDGTIVFCGHDGMVVRGRAGSWSTLDVDLGYPDLWSIVLYHEDLYIASQSRIYKLVGDELEPIDLSVEGYRGTHYRLQVVEDYLFSFGERDVLIYDGIHWTRVLTE
jgi:hypothetical protein